MGRHRGPWEKGDQFDYQHNMSEARAKGKLYRGEGDYAADKWRRDAGEIRPAQSEGCGKATAVLLSLLGGVGWALSEVVSRVV